MGGSLPPTAAATGPSIGLGWSSGRGGAAAVEAPPGFFPGGLRGGLGLPVAVGGGRGREHRGAAEVAGGGGVGSAEATAAVDASVVGGGSSGG